MKRRTKPRAGRATRASREGTKETVNSQAPTPSTTPPNPKQQRPASKAAPKISHPEKAQSLPSATEIATIAAILAPEGPPGGACKRALQFYIEAVYLLREAPTNLEDLVRLFATDERRRTLFIKPFADAIAEQRANTLLLDPKARIDPARKYLASLGLKLPTWRAVRDNLRKSYLEMQKRPQLQGIQPPETFEAFIARFERKRDSGAVYEIPKLWLEGIVRDARERAKAGKRKGAETRKNTSSKKSQKKLLD